MKCFKRREYYTTIRHDELNSYTPTGIDLKNKMSILINGIGFLHDTKEAELLQTRNTFFKKTDLFI